MEMNKVTHQENKAQCGTHDMQRMHAIVLSILPCLCNTRNALADYALPFGGPPSETSAEWERWREHTLSLPVPGGANTRQVVQRSESGVKKKAWKFKTPCPVLRTAAGNAGSRNGSMGRPSHRRRAQAAGSQVRLASERIRGDHGQLLQNFSGGRSYSRKGYVRCTVAKPGPVVVEARGSMALPNEDCRAKAFAYRPLHQPFERATLVKSHMSRIIVSRWLASTASQDVLSNMPAATNQVSYWLFRT